MNYHLVSAILKGVWAMDEFSALSYAPLLSNILTPGNNDFEFDKESLHISSYQRSTASHSSWNGFDKAPKGSIAIISLSGPLMKNDQYCGPRGMTSIGNSIKEADESKNIDGIILKIDSPGGSVDGTAALAEIVEQTKKPIIAFADGLVASAALWIGASADEIIAANNKTQIGSIGVLLSFADMQPAFEKMGVKFHQVVADQSKDKTKFWDDLRAGNYEGYKKEVLNPIAEDFISHMKQARPDIQENHLTGKVFFAQDVQGSLVDSIGNLDHAIARMSELIDQRNEDSNTNQNSAKMSKHKKINSVLGAEIQTTEEGAFLNNEQLEALETALPTKAVDEKTTENKVVEKKVVENKADNKSDENKTTEDPKDKIIADLQKTIQTLNASTVEDKEVVKSTDNSNTSTPDDFISSVARAQELNDLIDNFS